MSLSAGGRTLCALDSTVGNSCIQTVDVTTAEGGFVQFHACETMSELLTHDIFEILLLVAPSTDGWCNLLYFLLFFLAKLTFDVLDVLKESKTKLSVLFLWNLS